MSQLLTLKAVCARARRAERDSLMLVCVLYSWRLQAISRLATAMYDAERKVAIAQTHASRMQGAPGAVQAAALPLTNALPAAGASNQIPGTSMFSVRAAASSSSTPLLAPAQAASAAAQAVQAQAAPPQDVRVARVL
jgi:hypothetical protein